MLPEQQYEANDAVDQDHGCSKGTSHDDSFFLAVAVRHIISIELHNIRWVNFSDFGEAASARTQ